MVSSMATWDDVRRLAMALPETAEGTSRDGLPGWSVKGKSFAWENDAGFGQIDPEGCVIEAQRVNLPRKDRSR